MITSCHQMKALLSFFYLRPIWSNSEARFRIYGPWFFYQTKAENETKSHHIIAFIKTYYFCLKMPMFCQRILKLAKCRESWYYKAYFLKLDICAPIYQILGFLHNSNKNLRGVWFLPSSPTSK